MKWWNNLSDQDRYDIITVSWIISAEAAEIIEFNN